LASTAPLMYMLGCQSLIHVLSAATKILTLTVGVAY